MRSRAFPAQARSRYSPALLLDFLSCDTKVDPRIAPGGANGTRVNGSGVIVAAPSPRINFHPVTLACLGLLVEEARTNLLTYSQEFDNAAWTKAAASISANAVTAPDGAATADKLVESATNASHYVYEIISRAANTTSSISVYAKASERSYIGLQMTPDGANYVYCTFNVSTGTASTPVNLGNGSGAVASITSAGNGWYRCSLSGIPSSTAANPVCAVYVGASDVNLASTAYLGNGTSGVYIWGAQLEAGTFPTSYIPTVASAVTRAADSAVMTGTNFSSWFNASEGTFVVTGDRITAGGSSGVMFGCSETGVFNNSIYASNGSGTGNTIEINCFSGGVHQAQVGRSPANILNPFKLAIAYAANDFAGTVDGQTPNTDTGGTVPSPMQRLAIGEAPWGPGTALWNGHIRTLTYFNRRLSNATLQAITV